MCIAQTRVLRLTEGNAGSVNKPFHANPYTVPKDVAYIEYTMELRNVIPATQISLASSCAPGTKFDWLVGFCTKCPKGDFQPFK